MESSALTLREPGSSEEGFPLIKSFHVAPVVELESSTEASYGEVRESIAHAGPLPTVLALIPLIEKYSFERSATVALEIRSNDSVVPQYCA